MALQSARHVPGGVITEPTSLDQFDPTLRLESRSFDGMAARLGGARGGIETIKD